MYIFIGVVQLVLLVCLNYLFYEFIAYYQLFLFQAVKSVLLIIFIAYILYGIKRLSSASSNNINIKLSTLVLLLILLVLEFALTFKARSHHAENSYASIVWHHRYYRLNEAGYRDSNFSTKDTSKPAIVFLGDSYTAGYGINNIEQRYSNLTGNRYSEDYEFYNLGIKGTGISEQQKHLSNIKNDEKFLVYQLFINDLDEFCNRTGPLYDIYSSWSKRDKYFAKSMFLFNYIYFSFPNNRLTKDYINFFNDCYLDKNIFQSYIHKLNDFFVYAQNDLMYQRIIVVIMPILSNPELSAGFELGVLKELNTNSNIETIWITPLITKIPSRSRIVNLQDTHPSVLVNRIIADTLIKSIGARTIHINSHN